MMETPERPLPSVMLTEAPPSRPPPGGERGGLVLYWEEMLHYLVV